jgi:hypothetical protein
MAEVSVDVDVDSCCGGNTDRIPTAPSLDLSNCDCGRQAPPATPVVCGSPQETVAPDFLRDADPVVTPATHSVVAGIREEPAPPPLPPIFLVGCVFLT